jgi:hypothetical protein
VDAWNSYVGLPSSKTLTLREAFANLLITLLEPVVEIDESPQAVSEQQDQEDEGALLCPPAEALEQLVKQTHGSAI